MGYLSANTNETDRLELPSDPQFYVLMKVRPSYGDKLAAQSATVTMQTGPNGASATAEVNTAAYVRTLITRLVVEWNLTDADEQPLPITVDMIERLHPEDGDFLATEATKRVGERDEVQAGPFRNGSGPPSTATTSRTRRSPRS
jgi:hypothetical protein